VKANAMTAEKIRANDRIKEDSSASRISAGSPRQALSESPENLESSV
jgi:hypothetical protein